MQWQVRSSVIDLVTQIMLIDPEKLQRIQDATAPATDSASSICSGKVAPKMQHSNMLAKDFEDFIFYGSVINLSLFRIRRLLHFTSFERATN